MNDEEKKERALQTGRLTSEELEQVRAAARAQAQQGQVTLLLYHRDRVQVVPLPEGQSLVIGRSPPADIPIRDSSLSRQHARLQRSGSEIWVEDLNSTNGTWVDGKRITRIQVDEGSELTFGTVSASVRLLAPADSRQAGLQGHDGFQLQLEAEASRARDFGRTLALVMIEGPKNSEVRLSQWLPMVRKQLRSFDPIALYCCDIVEVLLPEVSQAQAQEFCSRVLGEVGSLRCGMALVPDHARSPEELISVARAALHRTELNHPIQSPPPCCRSSSEAARDDFEGPVVAAPAMKAVFATAQKLASSSIPVLLLGETGTGKEVIAKAIHNGGKRSPQPMISVNCGGIPAQLVESTLFGHERGAFTGAGQQAQGVFEAADGGTVLLDEIGELPPAAQTALLRVLETKRFSRVGSNREIEVDVRVLAATHRDLEAMCREGKFREDLFYRLNGMVVAIPPLRERPEEIEPLALQFMRQANAANERSVRRLSPAALDLLRRYPWPGNVRELRNAIERAVVIAQEDEITADDLPERVRGVVAAPCEKSAALDDITQGAGKPAGGLKGELDRREAELILGALRESGWDREKAAAALDLPLRTLAHKMQQHGIKKVSYEKKS